MIDLPNIYLTKYFVYFQTTEDMELPEFKGSMFRGAFGHNFKDAVCLNKNFDCEACFLKNNCSYYNIFETPNKEPENPYIFGVKKGFHPYLLIPPYDNSSSFKKGMILKLELSIFGKYSNLLPFFIFTFIKMGDTGIGFKRNKFNLIKVTQIDQDSNEFEIFNTIDNSLKTSDIILDTKKIVRIIENVESIKLEFLTPVRLQKNGVVFVDKEKFQISDIINSILKRYYFIASQFCNSDIPEYKNIDLSDITLAENNLYFKYLQRYSNRQKSKQNYGGFLGNIKLKGNLGKILPLLQIGEYLNVGKNTSFGLGKFKLIINS